MKSNKILVSVFFLTISLSSCHEKSKVKVEGAKRTETFEIYNTKGDEKNAEQDSLQYFESSEYLGSVAKNTSYFNANGELTGKEIFDFGSNDTLAVGSKYYDKDGQLLSSYQYIIDPKGQKIASYGFDSKGDLMRIESYQYAGGKVALKNVYEANHSLYRSYHFTYDQDGNESGLKIYDNSNQLILDEEYRIIKKDEKNKWVERWGFANGKPLTFHKRK